jgi:hypothetical protein
VHRARAWCSPLLAGCHPIQKLPHQWRPGRGGEPADRPAALQVEESSPALPGGYLHFWGLHCVLQRATAASAGPGGRVPKW